MKRLSAILVIVLCSVLSVSAQNSLDLLLRNTGAGTPTSSSRSSITSAGNTANSARVSNLDADSISPWIYGGNLRVSLSQASFSNWASGGENSAAGTITVDLAANYFKNKLEWYNYFYATYGEIFKESGSTKLDDLFELTTKFNERLTNKLFFSQALSFRSQFANGFQYSSSDTVKVSSMFAPAYMFLKVGIDYKPAPNVSIAFSPLMGKGTFVLSDDQSIRKRYGMKEDGFDAAGDPLYKKNLYEFGGGITVNASNINLAENVHLTSVLELFSNYLEEPSHVDIDWRFNMDFQISSSISANIGLRSIYDADIHPVDSGPKLQMMQTLSIGFNYKIERGKSILTRRRERQAQNAIRPVF